MFEAALAIDGEAKTVSLIPKTGSGYNADGEGVGTYAAPATIYAVVQPASGRAVMDVPEGKRSECKYLIWTRSVVKEDDKVVITEGTTIVIHVWDRSEDGGFYKAALGRIA